MRVIVVGSGGREHALCWKLRQSPACDELFCAPGNGGIGEVAEIVPIGARETERLANWARDQHIDLVVVGPDEPLADGLVDALKVRGVRAFGPTRAAAQIEWSKSWAKQLCVEHDIPVAAFGTFDQPPEAHRYVESLGGRVVVKADGLAVGKGAYVCGDPGQAYAAIDELMVRGAHGDAGRRVVIEKRLGGRELSATAVCDGTTYRMLPFSCDHKAVFDGNRGPNTGGMGTYSPADWVAADLAREIELRVVAPAVRALSRAGRPFVGFLYPGIMVTDDGIKVFEFNARLGDPEAQVLLPRLEVDLLELLSASADGQLSRFPAVLPVRPEAACCVVLASGGYPTSYSTGLPISGLDDLDADAIAFHAGTRQRNDEYETAGGRVVGITALGADLTAARKRAYDNGARVRFEGMHFRRDIGASAAVPV